MSIENVTSRITEIQARLSQLSTFNVSSSSAAAFNEVMATSGTTGTTEASTTGVAARGDAGGPGVTGEDVVVEARKYLGLPYVWGGTDPTKGMDCSGLVQVVYKNLGYDLPRVSYQQAASGRPVASMAEAQPGDLIAWDNSSRNNGVDHIAIYIGNGKMIEAPRTGLDIRVIDVPSTPDVIRRILPDQSAQPVASAAAGATSGALPMRAAPGTPYGDLINAAATRTGVPGSLLAAVAKQESGFDPRAVSPAGARGLMQLMPATARSLGVENALDPAQSIDGGSRYLATLIDKFGRTDLALAAYNAGPGTVSRYGGIPPYPETQNYVRNVMAMVERA